MTALDAQTIVAISGAAVAVISAIAAAVVKILQEIRLSREGSQLRHAVTQDRLDTIQGAACGAQVEAESANVRMAELERRLAQERAKREGGAE